ncbi:transposase [Xanthomonas euvesicatoria]|uniref:transposase n=1 Tax=Xanthomonas euvesicatoria TaxID=456327 RepID=UPI001F49B4C4|nr:transposase [Xanthomonas euvesicatoria]
MKANAGEQFVGETFIEQGTVGVLSGRPGHAASAASELSGVPMHVVQRGVNRCAIFLDDEDRHHYCLLSRMACERFAVRVHAFVLMDNHVHLLVSADKAGAVSSAMRLSSQSYVQALKAKGNGDN